ncbi:MAG: hypothetical protein WC443_10190, partial [Desulfobaccales bacterium]
LDFWKRMMVKDKGGKMPQFMSTHPTDASRLHELEAFLPEARIYPGPKNAGCVPAAPPVPIPGERLSPG